MSHISQERLIEMEAEMDRFEQEIQAGEDLPKVIIGSNTYSQVSAQLKMLRASSGITPEQRERKHQEVAAQLRMLRARAERESSPPAEDVDLDCDKSRLIGRDEPPPKKLPVDASYLVPPPPPPPMLSSGPSFVPHQLKHRPPPPPRPPGPPRMRPPPRFGGPMGPGPGMMPGPGHGPGPGGMPPGPGPFPGPRFGPGGPGPGPMRPMGPMGPMGPGPMGPGPGGPGPGPMGGPRQHDMMGSSGMYGVSSGEEHRAVEKDESIEEEEDDKPKVIYSSAPVITVLKPQKKKKKKRKAEKEGGEEGTDGMPDQQATKSDTKEAESSKPIVSTVSMPEPEDDFEVADMEIDNVVVPAKKEKKEKKKKFIRMAAGQTWEDQSLLEWDSDDFRLFCGDLGNEVSDEVLARAFNKYPSFQKAKVVRDKRSNKTRGYGFVSFRDPTDYVRAMREMNGKYVGNRPIKLRKSNWKDRNKDIVIKKEKEKKRLGLR